MQKIKIIQIVVLLFSLFIISFTIFDIYEERKTTLKAYALPKSSFSTSLSSENSNVIVALVPETRNRVARVNNNVAYANEVSFNNNVVAVPPFERRDKVSPTVSTGFTLQYASSAIPRRNRKDDNSEVSFESASLSSPLGLFAKNENRQMDGMAGTFSSHITEPFADEAGGIKINMRSGDPNEEGGSGIGTMPLSDGLAFMLIISVVYVIFLKNKKYL